jgi:hypothetical protein
MPYPEAQLIEQQRSVSMNNIESNIFEVTAIVIRAQIPAGGSLDF